ncbi:MAG: amidohydrolase family protein [Bryobacteraceae bacterium]
MPASSKSLRSAALAVLVLLGCAPSLRAEPADWIWTARFVVTMNPQRRIIQDGAVAVRGQRIAAVGRRQEIEKRFQAAHRLDHPSGILLPGFVDTHTHAAMSLFRGVADDLRLQDWLQNFIFPAEARNVDREFVRWGTRLACLEMALSGTTTYADMYYYEDTVAEATRECGLRGVLGETIIGFPAPDYKTPHAALAATEKYIQRFRNDPLIVPAVAPHAIYTTNDEILRDSRALANRYNVPLLIHLSETKRENDECFAKRKMSPTHLLDSLGVLNGRTLAAHCVWLDESDRGVLKERGVGVAHCPSSNMKLASGVADVVALLKMGVAVGIGPDGVAGSNNDADMMQEMDLAAKLQKVMRMDPQALPASQALAMATILGARALGLDKEIGSLEAGKRADMVALSLDEPHGVPVYNVVSAIVYSLKGSDVRDVMVNGRPIVRDRRMLTLNEAEILARAAAYGRKIQASLAH